LGTAARLPPSLMPGSCSPTSRMDLKGKTALVTGASRGAGRAIGIALADQGVRVFGSSRSPDRYDWPAGLRPLAMDLRCSDELNRTWKAAGFDADPPNIVVNNAGEGLLECFEASDFEQWRQQIELMLLAPMELAHLAMQAWGTERRGCLVNVSSLAVDFPIPYMSGYNAAKAGLAAFSESIMLENVSRRHSLLEFRIGDLDTGFSARMRSMPSRGRARRVWEVLCMHESGGLAPERAASKLVAALRQDRDGVLRAGRFFQVGLASFFSRLLSLGIKRKLNLSYYRADDA